MFAKPTHCRTHATIVALPGSNPDFGTKIKRPYRAFDFCGGDEGIRTLDTVARIPHFQCGALDQLCDVSLSVDYSSSDTSSTASSADSIGISSDDNDASNSASISRNNGSSLPTSNDSSPNSTTGASL